MNAERSVYGPRRVAETLPKVTKPAFAAHGFWEAAVLTEWPAIVGAALAAQTCPEKLGRDGALVVRVGGARALEVQHLEPVILDRIATYFGYRAVKRLAIRQGPLPRRTPPRQPETAPLTEAQKRALGERLDGVATGDLRAALEALGSAVLARRR